MNNLVKRGLSALVVSIASIQPVIADSDESILDRNYDSLEKKVERKVESKLEKKSEFKVVEDCYRKTCIVWADVRKKHQRLDLYFKGKLIDSWKVSTGKRGYITPNFDFRLTPNARTYESFTSPIYPRGGHYTDKNGRKLGNMPYTVAFEKGGYAIHGTGSVKSLGKPASHGCVRSPPDKAKRFMEFARSYKSDNQVWITVRK